MNLMRYKRDARSIPVSGEHDGMIGIGTQSHFSIADNKAYLSDPENGCEAVAMGTHLQYVVDVERS